MSLENKGALVTRGHGASAVPIALRLARDGALVAINYANNDQAATEIVATIEHNRQGPGGLVNRSEDLRPRC
jgi:NAD(P)-dependent dehydrogenase (short-subunit alcohol dehydrogenase family)